MKKLWALCALLAIASPVHAQLTITHGQSLKGLIQGAISGGLYGGTGYLQPYSERGNPQIENITGAKLFSVFDQRTITGANTAAESTYVGPIAGYPYLKALFKCVPATSSATLDTASVVVLAVSFRECRNGLRDSLSLFPEYASSVISTHNSADTLSAGHLAVGGANLPWSGEITLKFSRQRIGRGGGTGSNLTWYWPSGAAIPLDELFGRPVQFADLDVRVRRLAGPACVFSMDILAFTSR